MNNIATIQILVLLTQCIIVGSLLLFLFRLRTIFGLGMLFTALGVFQYMQVFLVASLYIEVFPGIMISPGSMVMFTGSLFAILLIYIREDALEARKVIYALLAANLVLAALQVIFSWAIEGEYVNNIYNLPKEFFTINSRVLLVGTIVLFLDAFIIIYLYERISQFISSILLRILISMVLVVSIDSFLFSFGAFAGTGEFWDILSSGLVAKLLSTLIYSLLFTIYLKYIDRDISIAEDASKPFQDIFYTLTYRQKYETVYEEKESSQQELVKSEKRFRALFETMAQGVTYQNSTGEITDANHAALEILGLTLDQLQGKTSFDPDWKSIREDGTDFPGMEHPSMVALQTGKEINNVVMGVFNTIKKEYRWIKIDAVPQFREGEAKPYQVFTTFDDISKRKQTEEKIQISEAKFRNIFENSVVGKSMTLMDGTLVVNRAFSKILGYTEEELAKIPWQSITHADDIDPSEQKVSDILSGKTESARWEKRYIHKNGEIVWVDINTTLQKDLDGKPDYFITAIYDITERKKAEQDLLTSELNYKNQANFLDTIIENSPFAMWISDPNGYLIRVNQVLRDTLEIPADLDITKYNILEDENFSNQGLTYILDDVFKNHKSTRFEMFWLGPETGEDNLSIPKKLWVFGSMFPITDQSGKLINVIFQYVDITERKLAEQELKQSEEKFRILTESSPNGIFLDNAEGKAIYINSKCAELVGLPADKALNLDWLPNIHPDDRDNVTKEWFKAIKQGSSFNKEYRWVHPDGKVVWTKGEIVPVKDSQGKILLFIGSLSDITEIKKANYELKRQSEFINTMTENQPAGIVACDADGKLVLFNKAAKEWHGIDVMKIAQEKWAKHYNLYQPDGIELLIQKDIPLVKAFSGERVENVEMVIKAEGQKPRLVNCNGASFTDSNGKNLGAVIVMNDITQARIIENRLKKSETELRVALSEAERSEFLLNEAGRIAKIGAWEFDLATQKTRWSEQVFELHAIPVGEVPEFDFIMGCYIEGSEEMLRESIEKCITERKIYELELRFLNARNEKLWVHAIGYPIINDKDEIISLRGVVQDITELKESILGLEESEKILKEAVSQLEIRESFLNETGNLAKVGGWDLDLETMTPYFSAETYRIYDIPPGKPPKVEEGINFYAPEARPIVQKVVAEAIEKQKPYDISVPFITAKGNKKWVRTLGRVQVKNNKAVRMYGAIQDITQQKGAEIRLQQSEEKYKDLVENSYDLVWSVDAVGKITFMNKAAKKIYGYEPEELIGKSFFSFIPEKHIAKDTEIFEKAVKEGLEVVNYESQFTHKNGSTIYLLSNARILRDKSGNFLGTTGTSKDVTEAIIARGKMEDYQKSLKNLTTEISLVEEKQRKEIAENIHDHLSQSLVISKMKLTDLQKELKNPVSKGELKLAIDHISNALENSRKITYDLSPPVLYELGLIETLYWLAEKTEQDYHIKTNLNTEITELELPEHKLILIYRIIQELINNIIKHAHAKTVDIGIESKDIGILIKIADDGQGFNLEKLGPFSPGMGGFGLFAVKERVQNLDGTFNISTEQGQGTQIEFYVPLKTNK